MLGTDFKRLVAARNLLLVAVLQQEMNEIRNRRRFPDVVSKQIQKESSHLYVAEEARLELEIKSCVGERKFGKAARVIIQLADARERRHLAIAVSILNEVEISRPMAAEEECLEAAFQRLILKKKSVAAAYVQEQIHKGRSLCYDLSVVPSFAEMVLAHHFESNT